MRLLLSKVRYERKPEFRVATNILELGNGEKVVQKRALGLISWNALKDTERMSNRLKHLKSIQLAPVERVNEEEQSLDFKYIQGKSLQKLIEESLLLKRFSTAEMYFGKMIEIIEDIASNSKTLVGTPFSQETSVEMVQLCSEQWLSPFFDITSDNIIFGSSGAFLIDYESIFDFRFLEKFVQFRAIFYLLNNLKQVLGSACSEEFELETFLDGIYIPKTWKTVIDFSEQEKEYYIILEEKLQNTINWKHVSLQDMTHYEKKTYSSRIPDRLSMETFMQMDQLKLEVDKLREENTRIKDTKLYKIKRKYAQMSGNIHALIDLLSLKKRDRHLAMTSQKKVAFFCERLLPGFGVDLVVDQQARILCEKVDLTVFAINVDKVFKEKAPYKIEELSIPLRFNPLKQDWNSFRFFLHNYKSFAEFDSFVIHTPTFNSWLPFLQKMGTTTVYYYGNSPSNMYKGLKRFRKNILDFSENFLYFRFVDNIASISHYLSKSLWRLHRERLSVIHLGGTHVLDWDSSLNLREKQQHLQRYGLNKKGQLVTYIGRLDYHNNPYKNTNFLMTLRKRLKSDQAKVLAIGFPENKIQEELYENGVLSVANATKEELISILEVSTVHCSPSQWEGFNLPLIEAQTLGVPVVAFDIGAHREVVQNNESGYLVNSDEEFIARINELLKNKDKRDKMSLSAKEFAKRFTWKNNVDQFEQLL